MTCTPAFFGSTAAGCAESAAVVVPLILDVLEIGPAARVVDVGCGQGWWAAEFARHGCEVVGIDGDVPDPQIPILERDLREPLAVPGRFDIAVSLEVAEHLPESRADSFVQDLCKLAPTVVFSAAVPHQTGSGHINCQWPSWWARLFAKYGYGVDGAWRFQIWDDDRVEPWYRQNIVIARRGYHEHVAPLDVVHPEIFESCR